MDNQSLDSLRHSTAHLLAAAVIAIWPEAKRTIGPAIENGFYFDFDFGDTKISEKDFPKIEKRMKKILQSWNGFERHELSAKEAKGEYPGNVYKHELIDEFSNEGQKLTFYKSGDYWDLCRGGHVDNPKEAIKHFKLLSVAGAYWRGDEGNKMLTRIYGTVFPTEEELQKHLEALEEAKKRDHRKLGKELDLFTFSDLVGSGLPLYTGKGSIVRRLINQFIEDLQEEAGYTQVWTPQIAKAELFKTSGHYDKYKEDMFRVHSNYSDEEFYLKPMNCPQHTQIYASQKRSYRDLPIRLSDFAMLYRDEKPGELLGLARVRAFSTDDAHIFCREDQVDEEMDKALHMTRKVMEAFGFKYRYRLSTRDKGTPEKYLGKEENWDKAEKWAERIMERHGIEHFDAPGEAAFYAPKMDLLATDSLGREWQLSTLQIDYVQPERFGLSYTNKDNAEETPIMIHRAILGSSERAMMILIEHFAGAFPLWLSPVQVKVLPISEKQLDYAQEVLSSLRDSGLRVVLNDKNDTLGNKIRSTQAEKVPYMLILGDKEKEAKTVSVRDRDGQEQTLKLEEFIANTSLKVKEKSRQL